LLNNRHKALQFPSIIHRTHTHTCTASKMWW